MNAKCFLILALIVGLTVQLNKSYGGSESSGRKGKKGKGKDGGKDGKFKENVYDVQDVSQDQPTPTCCSPLDANCFYEGYAYAEAYLDAKDSGEPEGAYQALKDAALVSAAAKNLIYAITGIDATAAAEARTAQAQVTAGVISEVDEKNFSGYMQNI